MLDGINLYNLRQIMMSDFQEFLVDGNISVLGVAPENILNQHAQELYYQYTELTQTDEALTITRMDSEIYSYDLKLQLAQACIDWLSVSHSQVIADILINEGFDYPFTAETLMDDLAKVVIECQRFVSIRDDIKQRREQITGEGKKVTYEYFTEIFISISQMNKYHVDAKKINVLEYASHYKQLAIYLNKPKKDGTRSDY